MSKLREMIHINKPAFLPSFTQGDVDQFFSSLQDQFLRNFCHINSGMDAYLTDWDGKKAKLPALNILEKEAVFTLEVELPGMDPQDVSVDVSGSLITVKAKKDDRKEQEEPGIYLRRELTSAYVQRTVSLPETAFCDKAEAVFQNGLLTITVPKKETAIQKPKKLAIRTAA